MRAGPVVVCTVARREAAMLCPLCGAEEKRLYYVPAAEQPRSVPLSAACYFCYLKLTGAKPPRSGLVPGSEAGSR